MGVSAKLRMPTHKGEGTRATHNLTGLGRPLRKFLGVRCGRMKVVSPTLGSVWGSQPNYGSLPMRGRASGLPIVWQGCGDPSPYFFLSSAVQCSISSHRNTSSMLLHTEQHLRLLPHTVGCRYQHLYVYLPTAKHNSVEFDFILFSTSWEKTTPKTTQDWQQKNK